MDPARENRNGLEEDLAAALQRVRMADDDPQVVAIAGREQNRGEQNHGQEDIDYMYVPRDVVAGLEVLSRTTAMSFFVHNLENLIYEGDPEINKFLCDRHDQRRIDFIKWCLFKHCDVEVHKREKVWKDMKRRLDQRVRKNRRLIPPVARENRNERDDAALQRIRQMNEDPPMVAIAEQNRGEQNYGQDDIDNIYVSQDVVAGLVAPAKRRAMSQFVLNLENLVYEGDPEINKFLCDRHDQRKIDFIRRCLFKHYDVEEHEREKVWKDMKRRLDQRVRDTRRAVLRQMMEREALNN